MVDDDIATGAIDMRGHVGVPRPVKRWRVFVVGRRAATTLVRESPAAIKPDLRLKVSDGPEPTATPAD